MKGRQDFRQAYREARKAAASPIGGDTIALKQQLAEQRDHIRKQADDIMALNVWVYADDKTTWRARADATKAENKRLREALDIFIPAHEAALEGMLWGGMDDDATGSITVKLRDIRRARAALAAQGEAPLPVEPAIVWRPIAEADNSIATIQTFGDITLRNSDTFWVRDEDGRVYEALWTDHKQGYWWDIEGESPVDPVEYAPHPLAARPKSGSNQ